jgi:ATP-binding cassette subfamily G (WHITE) protein 2 (PDR)
MVDYISRVGGYLQDSEAISDCKYCKIKETNVFLAGISSDCGDRWRSFGIVWAFIVFDIVAAGFVLVDENAQGEEEGLIRRKA